MVKVLITTTLHLSTLADEVSVKKLNISSCLLSYTLFTSSKFIHYSSHPTMAYPSSSHSTVSVTVSKPYNRPASISLYGSMKCRCGLQAPILTSSTLKSTGRKFFVCANFKVNFVDKIIFEMMC